MLPAEEEGTQKEVSQTEEAGGESKSEMDQKSTKEAKQKV